MSKNSFNNGDGILTKIVPPIISDPETAKTIESTTETSGGVMNFMSSSNFFISLILGGSM